MTRRCPYCSNNGHNSRTCVSRSGGGGGGGGVRLFGVILTNGPIIKKSASMGNLSALYRCSSPNAAASPPPDSPRFDLACEPDGYLSDDPAHASSSANRRGERKKGVPWTEEEHRLFLIGLKKLGRGDWRGISRSFVMSRTPTQVASHAQKHFIRQSSATRRRRSSLFDMASDPTPDSEEQVILPPCENSQPDSAKPLPSLNLSLMPEFEPMETTTQENLEESNGTVMRSNGLTAAAPGFFHAYAPAPFSLWPSGSFEEVNSIETSHHQVLKPIPILPKEPVNVGELVGLSHLSLEETQVLDREPSPLSLKLVGEPSRQSVFRSNPPVGCSDVSNGKNGIIQAVLRF